MLTPVAARKAQLQRSVSVIPPISSPKPSGSALVKGSERKQSDSLKGRSIKVTKDLDHGFPVNACSVEEEERKSSIVILTRCEFVNRSLGENSTARPALSQATSPRAIRYCEAEEALAVALKGSQQSKPTTDLQIDALRQATSVLNTRISDAADQLEKIRGLLANRGVDPGVYQNIQRQRWMEERRKEAAEHLSKVLEQHLTALSTLPRPSRASAPAQTSTTASNSKAKANSNLIAFFESSSSCQRISSRNRNRRRVPILPRPRPPEKIDKFPRVHNHKQLLPLKLKVSEPKPLFLQSKPTTMTITPPSPPTSTSTMSPATSSPPTPSIVTSPLAPIKETDDVDQVSHPLPPTPLDFSDDTGTATIWHSSPRSAADILSDFSVSVELPEYVGDLLSAFEANTSTSPGLRILSELPNSDARRGPRTLHKSSSLRRISALFSLGEGFSGVEGRGLSTRLKRRMSVLRQS
ncbi:hypothetical protein M413DRAFT_197771 [Hebeloma cylindrosporum]|uniref:Uncharacterized protein n=1 Tax=Hebeloma cylindrosporum TaxID=76867 RepID=A0A0C3BRM8_HEBCY|nr:hypothetical protein M413DRAFT_197771 [Hebeloma cylindrosporum h7]